MKEAVKALVRIRAKELCEYCQIPQELFAELFQIEHIVAKSHGGGDQKENLALACRQCNLHKGPNLSGIDPKVGELTRLYNPREDSWPDHFFHKAGMIIGRTPVGRTTVFVLKMNVPVRVEIRRVLGLGQ